MSRARDRIGAVVLAAGASTRLGRPKQLLQFRGRTLVENTVAAVRGALDGPVCVITGRDHDAIEAVLGGEPGDTQIVYFPQWPAGMGASLAFGVATLLRADPGLDAILVTVCDQPHLDASILSDLLALWSASAGMTVASAYNDTVGVPACFSKHDFAALQKLSGERGARSLLRANGQHVPSLSFPLGAVEVDTPEDVYALLNNAPSAKQLLWT